MIQNINTINNIVEIEIHVILIALEKEKIGTWSTILCLRIVVLAMTLIATLFPVSESFANLTLANVPSPIVLPTSYFPIFLLTFFILFFNDHLQFEIQRNDLDTQIDS